MYFICEVEALYLTIRGFMHWQEQKDHFEKVVSEMRDLLNNKGREYAGDGDALNNFKTGSDIGVSPLQKSWIFTEKHISSIKTYIKNGKEFSSEPIEGRILDAMNYLFLISCLVKEAKEQEQLTRVDMRKAIECYNKEVTPSIDSTIVSRERDKDRENYDCY